MKATGIIRKADELGRIVLPLELRRVLKMDAKTPLEMYTEGDSVILKRYSPGCSFCDSMDDTSQVTHGSVCKNCATEIARKIEEVQS